MTNGNDSISSIPMKRTSETTFRPALQKEVNGEYIHVSTGLTKREYFAAMAKYDENEFNVNSLKEIVGTAPPNDNVENVKWWIEAEAMVKVMKADALIEALNKPNNHESI